MRFPLELQLGRNLPGIYIHQLSHYLKYSNDEKLRSFGITGQQARMLAHIAHHQQDPDFCQKRIEKDLNLKGSSVTSLMHGLERGGFIRRVLEPQDSRKKRILLTEKGQQMCHVFQDIILENEQELLAALPQEDQEEFYRLLNRLVAVKCMAHLPEEEPPEQK